MQEEKIFNKRKDQLQAVFDQIKATAGNLERLAIEECEAESSEEREKMRALYQRELAQIPMFVTQAGHLAEKKMRAHLAFCQARHDAAEQRIKQLKAELDPLKEQMAAVQADRRKLKDRHIRREFAQAEFNRRDGELFASLRELEYEARPIHREIEAALLERDAQLLRASQEYNVQLHAPETSWRAAMLDYRRRSMQEARLSAGNYGAMIHTK